MALAKNGFTRLGGAATPWIFAALVMLFVQVATAQTTEEVIEPEVTNQSVSMDETVVTAERSLRSLRSEMEIAEDAAFDIFNEIYEGTDYEMVCQLEKQGGTVGAIQYSYVRVCATKAVRDILDEASQAYAEGYGTDFGASTDSFSNGLSFADPAEYEAMLDEHKGELSEKVMALVRESPEFRARVADYSQLKDDYDDAIEAKAAEGNFFTNLFRSDDE